MRRHLTQLLLAGGLAAAAWGITEWSTADTAHAADRPGAVVVEITGTAADVTRAGPRPRACPGNVNNIDERPRDKPKRDDRDAGHQPRGNPHHDRGTPTRPAKHTKPAKPTKKPGKLPPPARPAPPVDLTPVTDPITPPAVGLPGHEKTRDKTKPITPIEPTDVLTTPPATLPTPATPTPPAIDIGPTPAPTASVRPASLGAAPPCHHTPGRIRIKLHRPQVPDPNHTASNRCPGPAPPGPTPPAATAATGVAGKTPSSGADLADPTTTIPSPTASPDTAPPTNTRIPTSATLPGPDKPV